MKVRMGFFRCMDSMARDMRHPYIPSTTVLGDIVVSELRDAHIGVPTCYTNDFYDQCFNHTTTAFSLY